MRWCLQLNFFHRECNSFARYRERNVVGLKRRDLFYLAIDEAQKRSSSPVLTNWHAIRYACVLSRETFDGSNRSIPYLRETRGCYRAFGNCTRALSSGPCERRVARTQRVFPMRAHLRHVGSLFVPEGKNDQLSPRSRFIRVPLLSSRARARVTSPSPSPFFPPRAHRSPAYACASIDALLLARALPRVRTKLNGVSRG